MGRIKAITGGDTLTAAELYKERFNFVPVLKLWISGNNKPDVPDKGDAAWNRLRLVPFDNRIPRAKRDEGKKARLQTAEAAGILAWLVRGCIGWQAEGLLEPECMREAQADYRAEQDTFQAFLDDVCEVAESVETPMQAVIKAYETWRYDNLDAPELSQKTMRPQLQDHHFRTRRTSGWQVVGLRLKEKDATPNQEQRRELSSGEAHYVTDAEDAEINF
jgi:putative DNA primase/helicase